MKKGIVLVALLITALFSQAQDIIGLWHGVLKISGMSLRLDMDLQQQQDTLVGKLISLDQGNTQIPMKQVRADQGKLYFRTTIAGIEYNGSFTGDKIEGIFSQNGQQFPLTFTRNVIDKKEQRRPQEPIAPFPYNTEDITFFNAKDSVLLAGTFTKPATGKDFPVVVLISGSGPQNRNEELMGHKPFLVLADHLTRNGIAVLRYDDRGVARSKGVFATATSADFARDVDAAVAYLKTRSDINKKKIGLIGHSEGGLIAPMVAVGNKDVAYIVLMAGPGVKGKDVLLLQIDLLSKAAGVPEKDIKEELKVTEGALDILAMNGDTSVTHAALRAYLHDQYQSMPDSSRKQITEQQFNQGFKAFLTPWFRYFLQYDPAPALEKLKIPVLAVNGSKDLQVWAPQNLPAIEKALKKAGNKNYVIKTLPNLNHLFQEAKTGGSAEYAEIEQTLSPLLLDEITTFLKQKTKLP